MRRVLINALGKPSDSEDAAVVEVGESVLSLLREYLRAYQIRRENTGRYPVSRFGPRLHRKGTAKID